MSNSQGKESFEFLGPWFGPLGIVFGLPVVCYALALLCSDKGCFTLSPMSIPPLDVKMNDVVHLSGISVFLGWIIFVAGLHFLLPGKLVEGVKLPNGGRLTYKMNALAVLAVTLAGVFIFGFYTKTVDLAWAHANFVQLLTGSTLFSFSLSVFLYAYSFAGNKLLADGGNTTVPFYNFFIGRELNPRVWGLDLKEFFELYPGLIGWVVLDLCMAASQLSRIGYITNGMALVCLFHLVYVADALWYEPAILTTMDITTDGFGFMLAFGDITWVPFTYCLQARYLADNPRDLAAAEVALVVALKALGYAVFRGANGQKNQFRRDPSHPSVAHLRAIPTERGTRLIVSGWWGAARHINYTGDWLMGLAWCLPCGYSHVAPYFYAVYFGVLLVHREMRDEHACRAKYGRDWDKYCSIVRYRLLPYVY